MRKQLIGSARRIVVKVGTSMLTARDGRLNEKIISGLAGQIAELCRGGREVILVTSGAISAGMARMGLTARPRLLPQLQAAAAVGQSHLMHIYAGEFRKRGVEVAQILLTADDLKARHRHLNARNTMIALLERGIVPIINENDTVSTEEIKLGDNDTLSALVSNLVQADLLVLLTDIEGLMTQDPRKGKGRLIREIHAITPETEAVAGKAGSGRARGGMESKLKAAGMVVSSGEAVVIADGRKRDVLGRLFGGEDLGTFFHPERRKVKGRKRWIAFFLRPRGRIIVDGGAAAAILGKGKSLLATGIIDVKGEFTRGDTVTILSPDLVEIARGFTNYSADEVRRIKGLKTSRIKEVLGRKDYDEVVHRDNLALL